MDTERDKDYLKIWAFTICALLIPFLMNWLQHAAHIKALASFAPLAVGLLAFGFQLYADRKPLIELYSKNYPYRKLKPYGVISTFLIFEFVLMWGLYTKQILLLGVDLYLITVVCIGAIVYYHLFVRMKISLRFLFLSIFIPVIAAGAALGMASYFNILQFVLPVNKIGDIVFFNTIYWILFSMFFHVICEEPAFRGYLLQKLLYKGEALALVYSSLCYALWRAPFDLFSGMRLDVAAVTFCGNFITGAVFALLFIKGRNLLVAILCHGIIDGLYKSFFASSAYPGIKQYVSFLTQQGELQLLILWFGCLLIGLILLTFIPRKKLYAH